MNDSMLGETPIIRLELQHMKQSISHALIRHNDEMNMLIQQSVDHYCSEENLLKVINDQVKRSVDRSIQSSIESYYNYGEGKQAIKDLVIKTLCS